MSILNYQLVKISSFLSAEIYQIPQYQRGYSWEESQLEDFWMDLIQLFNGNRQEEHFLGQIVVHNDKEESKKYIIDGQQRISTSVIFLDVLRTKFDELVEETSNEDARNNADDINANYIGRITETKKNQRLLMGDLDQQFFFDNIQKRGPIDYSDKIFDKKDLISSNFNIIYASKYFHIKLKDFLCGYDKKDQIENLEKLYLCFIERFKVMSVETDDINEAYIIFETLNARGKELETADLLKNHVLRTSKHNMDSATKQWNKIIDNLDGNDLSRFIRYYWNSKNEFIREKDLYKALRKDADTPKKIEVLLNDLVSLSELYVALLEPDDNKFFNSLELNERISEINKLKATSFFPIVLSLQAEKYSEEDINEILKSIESLIVRNFVVAGKTANKYEVEFAKIAHQISEEILKGKEVISEKINGLMISDDLFVNNFQIFSSKTNNVIRYLLRKINNYNTQEVRIIDDAKTVHVEHILPKKIKEGQWCDFTEDEHNEYLWRLGNLTLLGQEYNIKAKNKTFNEKKEMYEKSSIDITKDLLVNDHWTIEEISNRQKQFAEIAIDIWKK
ncbi:DUF262 domain-containing HNH endonuclease family protein [Enterococcus faecalis]|uniref:DUF262 domain-containing protein n=1 Tax=Enterococcus faecalis TaxID=1351 RepID=UPI0029534404|nr:DUF262 domain-containing HNH endonuclease family protein [Enterococcus faecalis]MDV7769733.1 DUF262 domain-containing HNH endonuclease family protein [Enterococcus faecalis]